MGLVIILQESRTAMLLNGRLSETAGRGPKPMSLALSLALHAGVAGWMVGERPIVLPKPKSTYDQLIKGREQKLVWYHFKEKLPDVQSARARSDKRPMRAAVRMPRQRIVSAPKNAPKAPQMIWQKAPEINTDMKFDSANLVALSLPKVEAPKAFVPPPHRTPKLYTPQIQTVQPPEVQADSAKAPGTKVELAEVARPLRDFKAPARARSKTELPKIETATAPNLQVGAGPKSVEVADLQSSLPAVSRPL